ncbi:MAG: FAD-dependent oxidoreductase [Planctomycetota bacterium]|nr:FAD-dependent oxidoreductase [Planctomycetota bacterium]MDP6764282.1 FAD-dependent oxidoreductase [Planctomycetota bacterium]MDP6989703.1 FAD-dependent oxidoreductase [Planctomycetota bacterium]
MTDPFPRHARAVVIGGGIAGCSTAYHLARLGWEEVVLLERKRLTSGSTFHAAGLVGQLRSSASITRLLTHSIELYERLERETGQATGWRRCGGLRLACDEERWSEVRRQATTAASFGLQAHLLDGREAAEMWPMMDADDVVGAAYLPTDGSVQPSDLTAALARGARQGGVRIVEDCAVAAIRVENGRVRGVETDHGPIDCEVVVNCAGLWAREVGAMAGVAVPVQAVKHQFAVSEPIEGIEEGLPTLRDPDRLVYFKEEVGGLVYGGYELDPHPVARDEITRDFHFQLFEPDWEHFTPLAEAAVRRVPALGDAGVRLLTNGPEAFTPDGKFLLGEAPAVRGFFVGAGFNAFGIAAGGGAGRALAEWIVGGEPSYDLWPVDLRRFGPHQGGDCWVRERTLEAYAHHYTMAWPHEELVSGRPLVTSPLYERLERAGACFGSKHGWERPNWFAPEGVEPADEHTFGRPNCFAHVAREHRAARERVALFDESSFSKLLVEGPDAERALSWLAANDVARPPGRVVYTQLLNERGGIECDLTITRLEAERFYVVTGTAFGVRDRSWIERRLPEDGAVSVREVTEAFAVLGLMGPAARRVLAAVTAVDVEDEAFPLSHHRTLHIAGAPVEALRMSFVGELGWELHVGADEAGAVFDALWEAGQEHGMRHAGYRAIDSLRLEKGYRVWGADLTPDDTPLEAGLAWACKLDSPHPFLGREALEAARAAGTPRRRLVSVRLADPNPVLLGGETILREGERVGWLSSGGFGHTLGVPVGLGYVRAEGGVDGAWLAGGRFEVEVAGERFDAAASLRAPL